MYGLLIAVASLVVKHRFQGAQAPVAVALMLSCSKACGIFPDQESNTCPLHWQADSYPLDHQGSPIVLSFDGSILLFGN